MPSDLKPVPTTQQFVAPPSNAGLGTLPPRVTTQAGNATDGIPSAQDPLGMHIERDGDRRWLVVDGRTPEQLADPEGVLAGERLLAEDRCAVDGHHGHRLG